MIEPGGGSRSSPAMASVAVVVRDANCVGRLQEFFETQVKNRVAGSSASFSPDEDDDDDEENEDS